MTYKEILITKAVGCSARQPLCRCWERRGRWRARTTTAACTSDGCRSGLSAPSPRTRSLHLESGWWAGLETRTKVVCACMYVCTYVLMAFKRSYACEYVYICIYIHTHTNTHAHAPTHTYTHTPIHTRTHTHTYIYMSECIYLYMHI